ncbi:MAG TPA: efflux RND transporter periplasmic adaptor subunit [Anaerolineales bacterium]
MTAKRTNFFSFKGKFLWIPIAILVFASVGGYAYYSKALAAAQTTSGSQVQTAVAQRGNLVLSASGTGTLIANSDASFGFETSGQVTKVYVEVGDQVHAGQVLAQLDDTLAQMKYAEARQDLQELSSAASIATVQKEIATAQDTEFQARTWLEYLISPQVVEAEEKVASAEQNLAEAQAQAKANPSDATNRKVKESQAALTYWKQKMDQAQTYYKNVYAPEKFGEFENVGSRRHPKQVLVTYIDPHTGEELPKIDWPSSDDLAKARNNLAQAQETIQEGEMYLETLKTGMIPEGAIGKKLNTLYEAQLALKNAKSAFDATQLIAPVSGIVTSLDLNVGEQVDTSSVITISQLSQPYTLDVYLDEADWNMAHVGNKVNITFKLLPEEAFSGKVTLVYSQLNSSSDSSLVHLVVQLDQTISQDLPAGTGASVDVIGDEAQDVLLVPVGAIHKSDGGNFVTVIQNGQQVEHEVEIGLKNDSYAEVKSGLETGDIVLTKSS